MSSHGFNQGMMPPPTSGNMYSTGSGVNPPTSSGTPSSSKIPSSMPPQGAGPPGQPMQSPYAQHYPHPQGPYGRPGPGYGQYGGPGPYASIGRPHGFGPNFPSNGPVGAQHPPGYGPYVGPQSGPPGGPMGPGTISSLPPGASSSHGASSSQAGPGPFPSSSSGPPSSGAASPGAHAPTGAQKAAEAAMIAAAASRAPGSSSASGSGGYSSPPNSRGSQFGSMSPGAPGPSKSPVAHAPWKDVQGHGSQFPPHSRPYPGMAPSSGYPDQKGHMGNFSPHGGPMPSHQIDASGHSASPYHGMPPHHSGANWGPHPTGGHGSHGVGYPGYSHPMGPHSHPGSLPPPTSASYSEASQHPSAGHMWPPQQSSSASLASPPHTSVMRPPSAAASPSPVTQSVPPSSLTTTSSASGGPRSVPSPLTTSSDRPPSRGGPATMPPPPPSIHSEDSQGSTDSGGAISNKTKSKPEQKPGHQGPMPSAPGQPYGQHQPYSTPNSSGPSQSMPVGVSVQATAPGGPHGAASPHLGGPNTPVHSQGTSPSTTPAGPHGPHAPTTSSGGSSSSSQVPISSTASLQHGPGNVSGTSTSSIGPGGHHGPSGPHGPHAPIGPHGVMAMQGSIGPSGPTGSGGMQGSHPPSGPHGPGFSSFPPSSSHMGAHLPRPSSGPSPSAGSDSSPAPLGHPHHPPTPNSGGMMSPPPPPGPISDMPPSQFGGSPKIPVPNPNRKPTAQDKLMQLYTMGPEPDRRSFLESLFSFNEEKGSPITAMPQVSKQPLDLYKLYMQVREKGGMVEVTRNKTWKDVAQVLNIGCSASAAFTVRKNYIKYLFAYECKFDRGDVDPLPIVADLEAQTSKKGKKGKSAAEQQLAAVQHPPNVPSPGSGNSQDGFPRPPSHGMMDVGYGSPMGGASGAGSSVGGPMSGSGPGFPHGPPGGMMGGPNMPLSTGGMMPGPPTSSTGDSINIRDPFSDDPSGAHSPYGSRGGMPPFSGPPSGPNQGPYGRPNQGPGFGSGAPIGPGGISTSRNDPYASGSGPNPGWVGPPRDGSFPTTGPNFRGPAPFSQPGFESPPRSMGPPSGLPPSSITPSTTTTSSTSGTTSAGPAGNSTSGSTSSASSTTTTASGPSTTTVSSDSSSTPAPHSRPPQTPATGSSAVRPNTPGATGGPRPHGPYGFGTPYSQAGPYGGPNRPFDPSWAARFPPGRGPSDPHFQHGEKRHPDFQRRSEGYGSQYPGFNPSSSGAPRPTTDSSSMISPPPHMQPPMSRPGPDQPPWTAGPSGHRFPPPMATSGGTFTSPRPMPPPSGASPFRPGGPFPPGHPGTDHSHMRPPTAPHTPLGFHHPQRKEIPFPPDSVEAVTPILAKRKRLAAKDIGQVDPWRLLMSLRSGLLGESTWAIDTLNIMTFDDSTVVYFGLAHLPGLVDVLLDHFKRYLKEIFNIVGEADVDLPEDGENRKLRPAAIENPSSDAATAETTIAADEGYVFKVMDSEEENFTFHTREGKEVKVVTRKEPPGLVGSPYEDVDAICEPEQDVFGTSIASNIDDVDDISYIYTRFHSIANANFQRRQFLGADKSKNFHAKEETARNPRASTVTKTKVASAADSTPPGKLVTDEKMESDDPKEEISSDQKLENDGFKADADKENRAEEKLEGSTKADSLKKSGIKTTNANGSVSKYAPCANESDRDILETVASGRKRKASESANAKTEGLESECYVRDTPIFNFTCEGRDELVRRCVAISNVFRSLSFIPGNDHELGKHSGFLGTLGRLLLLHHDHSPKSVCQSSKQRYENLAMSEEETIVAEPEPSSSQAGEKQWWWTCLDTLRENFLVILSNISGAFQLNNHPEELILPLLDGMLHWSVCPSSYARDPLPTLPAYSVLSPQRLVLEALCKMSIHESNVDLLLATPPFTRIDRLLALLTEMLANRKDQVTREFAVVLLSNLSPADSFIGRCIAGQTGSVSQFISFLEEYDAVAANVASASGIHSLRDNPEHTLGTSLDMLRRIGTTLVNLSRVPENAPIFRQFQSRLLDLAMSQVLDQQVATRIAEVLFQISEAPSMEGAPTSGRSGSSGKNSSAASRTQYISSKAINFVPSNPFPSASTSAPSQSIAGDPKGDGAPVIAANVSGVKEENPRKEVAEAELMDVSATGDQMLQRKLIEHSSDAKKNAISTNISSANSGSERSSASGSPNQGMRSIENGKVDGTKTMQSMQLGPEGSVSSIMGPSQHPGDKGESSAVDRSTSNFASTNRVQEIHTDAIPGASLTTTTTTSSASSNVVASSSASKAPVIPPPPSITAKNGNGISSSLAVSSHSSSSSSSSSTSNVASSSPLDTEDEDSSSSQKHHPGDNSTNLTTSAMGNSMSNNGPGTVGGGGGGGGGASALSASSNAKKTANSNGATQPVAAVS